MTKQHKSIRFQISPHLSCGEISDIFASVISSGLGTSPFGHLDPVTHTCIRKALKHRQISAFSTFSECYVFSASFFLHFGNFGIFGDFRHLWLLLAFSMIFSDFWHFGDSFHFFFLKFLELSVIFGISCFFLTFFGDFGHFRWFFYIFCDFFTFSVILGIFGDFLHFRWFFGIFNNFQFFLVIFIIFSDFWHFW